MNVIQRTWLKVLRPVTTFVNEKLAQRPGMLGRLGRFFAFGPREFGYHPSSKLLAYMNQILLSNLAFGLHRYSYFKSLTKNGFNSFRAAGILSMLGPLYAFYFIVDTAIPNGANVEEGTTLKDLGDKLGAIPLNALNDRISAHFTEINGHYSSEMAKRIMLLEKDIINERTKASDQVKKTKYAIPSYQYRVAHSRAKE